MMKRIESRGEMFLDDFANVLKKLSSQKNILSFERVGQSLQDKETRQISGVLVNQKNSLQVLDLKDNNIRLRGIESLCKTLIECRQLCYLRLSRNLLIGEAAKTLTSAFSDHPNLQILKLANNKLQDWGAISIANLLRKNKVLQLVSLSHNGIGDAGLEALASALRKNTSLRCFHLTGNNFTSDGVFKLVDALKNNSTLRVLKVDKCRIDDEGALNIIDLFHDEKSKCKLVYLKYRPGNKITKSGELKMNKYISTNGYVNINAASLNEGTMSVGDALYVNVVPRGDDGIAILLSNIAQDTREEIHHLQVSCNDICDKVLDCLGICWCDLSSPISHLRSIKFSHNVHVTSKGMALFLQSMKPLKFLEILHVSDVVFDRDAMKALTALLRSNKNIKSLKLTRDNIDSDVLKTLLQVLTT